MLSDTSSALPWPLFRRSRVSMSIRMSATIFSSRLFAESTCCIVPQRCLSRAFAMSVRPPVLASNHWSTLPGAVISWSMSRASELGGPAEPLQRSLREPVRQVSIPEPGP